MNLKKIIIFCYFPAVRANILLMAAGCLFASGVARAASPVWALNYNQAINLVDPTSNVESPFIPSPIVSDSLAADPAGILYVADPNGTIYTVQGSFPIGSAGLGQVADLSYSSGGLWGFSNASDTLFFFDLGTTSVTYSLPITSGLLGYDVTGVTRRPSTGDIYLSGNTGLNQDSLFVLDLNTSSALLVGGMSHGDAFSYISDIEFDATGALLAMTWYHRDFYLVNPSDASTTLMSLGPHRDVTGLAVDTSQFTQSEVPEPATWAAAILLTALGCLHRRHSRSSPALPKNLH